MAYVLTDLVTVAQAQAAAQRAHTEAEAIRTELSNRMTSVYKVKGSLAFADLTAELLVAANEGNVYNVTDDFTTTANFIEGAGKKHTAGSNVVIVEATPADTTDPEHPVAATYKFDVHAGDLSGLQELVSGATNGNLAGLNANGQSTDSGIVAADVVTKVSNGTENNIVLLDANGKIKDSGIAVATNTEFNEMLSEIYD